MKTLINYTAATTIMLLTLHLYACQVSQSSQSARREQQVGGQAPNRNLSAQANAHQAQESDGQALKLYPIDEGSQDTSFEVFRKKLLEATRKHDGNFVLSILEPKIINSSDGVRGIEEFKETWKIDQPDSRLWETLTDTLSLGGTFSPGTGHKEFCAPYVTTRWQEIVSELPKNADPLDYQVIIEKDVALRSAPNSIASTVENLSYDVVKVDPDGSVLEGSHADGITWAKISTITGKEGYVLDKYIRSPSDYQACFSKIDGKWLMTILAARE